MSDDTFDEWAIVELMGHRRLAGRVTEQEIAGRPFLRLDVPDGDDFATQFYGAQAVYCLTPCDELTARSVAVGNRPAPVHRWELPSSETAEPAADDGRFFVAEEVPF